MLYSTPLDLAQALISYLQAHHRAPKSLAAMPPRAGSVLLRSLETSNFTDIHQRFSEHLKPFSEFVRFGPNNSKTAEIVADQSQIRSLAERFLPFIGSALTLVQTQLVYLYNSSGRKDQMSAKELFDVYKLCIDCLTFISPSLMGKSFAVHSQRCQLIKFYVNWGRFEDAEVEGFWILERLFQKREISLPEENVDPDLACLVVEIVMGLIQCSFKSQRKEDGVYQRVLSLVKQVEPWFRVRDSKVFEKFHRQFVTNLSECTLFMLREVEGFNTQLVQTFCLTTLSQSQKSPQKDRFFKTASYICSLLSSTHIDRSSIIHDILQCLLDFIVCGCKVGMKDTVNECFGIMDICARKCRLASGDSCTVALQRLENLACNAYKVLVPTDSILRIYAAGLCTTDALLQQSCTESESSLGEALITLSAHSGNDLLCLTDALHSLSSYFDVSSKRRGSLECSINCKCEHGEVSFLSYLKALAFFCDPFAKLVNKGLKLLFDDKQTAKLSSSISCILDAFQQFCDACLIQFSGTSEWKREFIEFQDTLVSVAIAALTISLKTDKNVERSVHHIERMMSTCWIQVQQMRSFIGLVNNVGVQFLNAKQLKQALVAFDLCYKCAWNHVSFVTNKYIDGSEPIHDSSPKAVTEFVDYACSRTANFLLVLHKSGSSDVCRVVVDSLINWSVVSSLFENLGAPTTLVEKWVEITCEEYKDVVNGDAPILFCLLSESPRTVKERAIGIILEQELQSFEKLEAKNMNLCQRMQLDIIDVLLLNVYVTHDYLLQKSMILIKKGRVLRARGINGLINCIECLSEAISILRSMKQDDDSGKYSANYSSRSHNLALAYCLRALCVQESQLNSDVIRNKGLSIEEVLMNDIPCALELWLSINWSSDDHYDLENAIQILCCIADLLSIKGYFHFYCKIIKLLVFLMERKTVPPEKCFTMLWTDRRLTHALCCKPIDEGVISSFAQHFDVRSDIHTVGFWLSCLNNVRPLVLAFRQKFSLYDSILPQLGHCHPGSPLVSIVTVDEVKEVTSALISNAPTIHSNFLVGHLYYDLGERLISSGQLVKALSFAKKALRVRTELVKKKFNCAFENHSQNNCEFGKVCTQKKSDSARLEIFASVATEFWPHKRSSDIEQHTVTQWNVLQCYLESLLQVGVIHGTLGNVGVAEKILVHGKNVSTNGGLPIFRVGFASALGEIYCKEGLWDLAGTELNTAKQILLDGRTSISCKQCQLTLEVTLDQRLGDLTSICSKDNSFSAAIGLYRSALDKLKHFEWEIPFSFSTEASHFDNKAHCSLLDTKGSHLNLEYRKSKNAPKRVPKEQKFKTERMTRSRTRSTCSKEVNNQDNVESECTKFSSRNSASACHSTHSWTKQHLEPNRFSTTDFGCAEMIGGNQKNCWKCLLVKVVESGNMQDVIHMKWEFHCRRLSLKLLNEIGKCFGDHDKVDEMHQIYWQSIGMMFDRNPFDDTYSSPSPCSLEFLGKEIQRDAFAIERAGTLYNLSWFSLKNMGSRKGCCDLSRIQLQMIVSCLLESYILSREVPILSQKASRLLATIFLCSTLGEKSCFHLFPKKTLCGSHWAAFFHQASLGTYFNNQLCSKSDNLDPPNSEFVISNTTASTEKLTELCNIFRFAPGRFDDLEKFVIEFFRLLPSTTIICISLLGSDYASILRNVVPKDVSGDLFSSTAWMLLSRLNSDKEPIVMLLPAAAVPQDMNHDADCSALFESAHFCPWSSTVVDEVAPDFRLILEESHLTSLITGDTRDNRLLFWTWRKKLNERLDKFLRNIEDSWLGPWRCLLLGAPLDSTRLNTTLSEMKCELNINDNLLRVILGGGGSVSEIEECISQLLTHKACVTGGPSLDNKCNISSVSQMLHQCTKSELEAESDRQPIIMVLDSDVQMLPWESLPVLRNEEIYRMPSVSSICALIDGQEEIHPSIDPRDAFYLLNPSGDLISTQNQIEKWLEDEKLVEGKAGSPPSLKELTSALETHDLFLYFGHGSGTQYITRTKIEELKRCGATLLMGCSSGCCNPDGAPLSYLLAGSPCVIANLWDVTDKDVNRFGISILTCWLRERERERESYYYSTRRNLEEEFKSISLLEKHNRRPNIGSFMGKARDACRLPFLTGAAPVCYGLPTRICKKQP